MHELGYWDVTIDGIDLEEGGVKSACLVEGPNSFADTYGGRLTFGLNARPRVQWQPLQSRGIPVTVRVASMDEELFNSVVAALAAVQGTTGSVRLQATGRLGSIDFMVVPNPEGWVQHDPRVLEGVVYDVLFNLITTGAGA